MVPEPHPFSGRALSLAILVALLGGAYYVDASTGATPFQHLYYVPIIFAGLGVFRYGGPIVGVASILLYHLANPTLLTERYHESDVVQIILFLVIGIVTERLASDRRRLRQLAITDDLTGLYNLRGFHASLVRALREARASGRPFSMLVLDVDRLKSINDTHGHRAGADAVRLVGRQIAAHLPGDAFACRFGGDEFVVAMPGGERVAIDAAQALCAAVRETAPELAGMQFPPGTLTISVGVASDERRVPGDALTDEAYGEVLFRVADGALYVAKASGRDRVSISGETPAASAAAVPLVRAR